MNILKEIHNIIQHLINNTGYKTQFRPPLVGCAAADDYVFTEINNITHADHMLPENLLPDARSVVAFFLPFGQEIIASNRRAQVVSREWTIAYIETNELISNICLECQKFFKRQGIRIAWEQPTHSFDKKKLVSTWSHRHAAYAAGLGTFGLNNLLITSAGCAGRVGSLVVDAEIKPTPKPAKENCLFKVNGKCGQCIQLCPTGALKRDGFDRHRCYQWLLKWDKYYSDLPLTDVCGKCSLGSCATKAPVKL